MSGPRRPESFADRWAQHTRDVAPPDEDATVWTPLPSPGSEPPATPADEEQQPTEDEEAVPEQEAESWPCEAKEESPEESP